VPTMPEIAMIFFNHTSANLDKSFASAYRQRPAAEFRALQALELGLAFKDETEIEQEPLAQAADDSAEEEGTFAESPLFEEALRAFVAIDDE
jgi:hypothetical protein